jgi:hypothetical protein
MTSAVIPGHRSIIGAELLSAGVPLNGLLVHALGVGLPAALSARAAALGQAGAPTSRSRR